MLARQWNLLVVGLLACFAPAIRAQTEFPSEYFAGESSDALDFDASFASFMQPRLQSPSGVAAETPQRSARSSQRSSYVQLARAPNMFGDWFNSLGQVVVRTIETNETFVTDLPQAGGRIPRVVENNKPIPMDRVYFAYSGFQNAIQFGPQVGTNIARQEVGLNRYTLGAEKTFNDGDSSLEVRLPLTDGFEFDSGTFALDSGNVGNLSLLLKHLVYEDEMFATAVGLGLVTPTGSNLEGQFGGAPFVVNNEAYHLFPYVGLLATPDPDWFVMAFMQLDFALNGNDVTFGPGSTRAVFTEQNLFFADLSVGRWLYQNNSVDYLTGIAAMVELHYTSTMQDADTLTVFSTPNALDPSLAILRNPANRFDILNLTTGVHFNVTQLSDLRVGVVVPLRPGGNRQFDSEIQVSFNRYF